ncbi:MAG: biotin/lipoyl-binding protein [Sphingobacteriales bacterium]|nr:biotin/lipoyl-binding protein [Sphingobacteriales bacterium]
MSFVADGFIVKPTSVSNKIVSSGRLAANEQVNIQPEVNGKITQIFFTEGKAVNKGATLGSWTMPTYWRKLTKFKLNGNFQ